METFKAPSKVTLPTLLWSLFSSELDEIQKNLLPSKTDVLLLQPQNRIRDRLGDNAGYMMAIYLKVSEIMHEEEHLHLPASCHPKCNVFWFKYSLPSLEPLLTAL